MEKKRFYLALFVVLLLASGLSFFMGFSNLGITGLVSHVGQPGLSPPVTSAYTDLTNTLSGSTGTTTSSVELTNLQRDVEDNKNAIARLNANVQGLASQVEQLNSRMDSQLGTINTGLAGLQQNIDSTQTDIENIQKASQKGRLVKWLALIFLVLAIIAGVYYYKTNEDKFKPEIINYITNHIKQGRKYHHIKDDLLKAGWQETDIEQAYRSTVKHNYSQYKKEKKKSFGIDSKKVMIISGAGIVLILAIIFILRGASTGQAYQFYGGVADYEKGTGLNRNLSNRLCFPPRVMINGQCCDDRNGNRICDNTEGYVERDTSTLTGAITIGPAPIGRTPQAHSVVIDNNGFTPSQLNIIQGDTVIWSNTRTERARPIGRQGCEIINNLDNPLMPTGQTFRWLANTSGACNTVVGIGNNNEVCYDDNQCSGSRTCINGQCKFVADLYTTTGCSEMCTILRVKLSTSHPLYTRGPVVQNYTLRMGLGSYTGGGALHWTILPMPDFCKPANAARISQQSNTWRATIPVPFAIREISNRQILRNSVTTISPAQSRAIPHETLNLYGFTIGVNDIHMTCGQSVFS